jgi:hypothetical protein
MASKTNSSGLAGLMKAVADWFGTFAFAPEECGGVVRFDECDEFGPTEASRIIARASELTLGGAFDVEVKCLKVGGRELQSYHRQFKESPLTLEAREAAKGAGSGSPKDVRFPFGNAEIADQTDFMDLITFSPKDLPEFESARFVTLRGEAHLMLFLVEGKPCEDLENLAVCFAKASELTDAGANPSPVYYTCH